MWRQRPNGDENDRDAQEIKASASKFKGVISRHQGVIFRNSTKTGLLVPVKYWCGRKNQKKVQQGHQSPCKKKILVPTINHNNISTDHICHDMVHLTSAGEDIFIDNLFKASLV